MIEAIERIYSLVLHAIGRGRITAAKDDGNVQLLQIRLGPDEIRDNTARLAEYGFTSMPPIGSDAVALFIGGNRSSGVIVATGHQASRLKNLQVGEVAIFDNQGQSVYLTRNGIVINGANLPITVNNTPKLIVNAASEIDMNVPLVKISGDVIDNAGTNTKTMAQMRSIYNSHTHIDPQGGSTSTPSVTQ